MIQIHILGPDDPQQSAWDQFVRSQPDGTFFHLSGWRRVLSTTFKHPTYYLYAMEDQQIVGVLPMAWVKSMVFGSSLISTPNCVYGGALGKPEVRRALEQEAVVIGQKLGVDQVELRYKAQQDNDWMTRSQHATFGCDLAEDEAAILAGIRKGERAVIRHALQNDLTWEIEQDSHDFYQVYSENLRNLGTPVFPRKLIDSLQHEFPGQTEILTVRHQGQPVSSVVSFYYEGEVLPYYGAGKLTARTLKSSDLMYYRLMCHAKCHHGCHYFDFGRSKIDSGPFRYKEHWGMKPRNLHYQYKLVRAQKLSVLSPNNPKYRLFIRLWQKLPLSVTRWLGPFIARYLG